ncbi:MAG: hypothetical protein OXT09_21560, partial [Myxococcales bacterium]|nr:hypothetical protein [Myxococcales bacterium]
MSTPEPIATGTLAKTPLPHLLVYLEQKKLSGTLALWPDDVGDAPQGQDRILLLKGRPVAGRLLQKTESLRDGMLALFARTNAPYAFYDTNLLGDDRVSGRVDPLALIAESLRSTAREDVVAAVLQRYEGVALQLLPGAEIGRYQLKPGERALVQLLQNAPSDIATLIAGSGMPEAQARRVIYLLAISKAIAPTQAQPAAPGWG